MISSAGFEGRAILALLAVALLNTLLAGFDPLTIACGVGVAVVVLVVAVFRSRGAGAG